MNKSLILLFFIFIFVTCNTEGQDLLITEYPDYNQNALYVYGNAGIQSDFVPLAFSSYFFNGTFISSAVTEKLLYDLGKLNRFGFESSAGLTVFQEQSVQNNIFRDIRFLAGYQHQTMIYSRFTEDAFRLVFSGNEFTVGSSADIAKCNLKYYQYDKIFFGFQQRTGKNKKGLLTLIPFITFHKPYYDFHFEDGYLSTAADTSEITLQLKGRFDLGNSADKRTSSMGGGIDFCYSDSALICQYLVSFKVENFGFFRYTGSAFRFDGDSLIRIQGLHITDLSGLDSALTEYSDSIVNAGWAIKDSAVHTGMLPLKISLEFLNTHFEKFGLHGKISIHPFLYSFPQVEILPIYKLNSTISVGLPFSAGGMGGLRAGLYSRFEIKKFIFAFSAVSCHRPVFRTQTGFSLQGLISYHF